MTATRPKVTVNVRLEPEQLEQIKALASLQRGSVGSQLRQAVDHYVADQLRKPDEGSQ